MARSPSIDLLKGVMILLVMGGHVMELTQQSFLALWIGAGFRMPLMIGISGYLLNITRIRTTRTEDFLGRVAARMLLPWLVAMIVYHFAGGGGLSWTLPLDFLLRPPFHLWYIPALFFLILITRLLPLSPLLLLAIGTPVSLAAMYSFGPDHGPVGVSPLLLDSRFLLYPVYFFFGMLTAQRRIPQRFLWIPLVLAGLGVGWWSGLYGSAHGVAHVPARLLMCLGLIALLPTFVELQLSLAPINRIGQDSLFFYLWHPLVMGLVLLSGTGALATLGLSTAVLFGLSLFADRGPLFRLLKGNVSTSRPAPPPAAALLPASA